MLTLFGRINHSRATSPLPLFTLVSLLLTACAQPKPRTESNAATKPAQGTATVTAVKGKAEASPKPTSVGKEWTSLFDGKTLAGWTINDFAGGGEVKIENGQIVLHSGLALTGVSWTNELPKMNYEIRLEGMKIEGSDFFCCLTFPVRDSHCSFVAGGWGGGVVGISSIDGMDASENETTKYMNFQKGRWYRIRVRVTPAKLEGWIDDEQFVDQPIEGRRISMRPGEIEIAVPFGVATYQTTGALRNIQIRRLE